MNRISICTIALIFILGSCSERLDITPRHTVTVSDFTIDELGSFEVGVYRTMMGLAKAIYFDHDIKGENFKNGNSSASNDWTFMDPSNISWAGYYTALAEVNTLLQGAERYIDDQEAWKSLGTAYFFRAYIYYNLVTRWGGVPILREPTFDKVARSSEADVWSFIEEDILKAISFLPGIGDRYYVSREAGMALAARVFLAEGKLNLASEYADSVINLSSLSLDPDYRRIFTDDKDDETIFAFSDIQNEYRLYYIFLTYNSNPIGGWSYQPSDEAWQTLYSVQDTRGDVVFGTQLVNSEPLRIVSKYNEINTPIVLFRLSELYLISAESKGYIDGLPFLNVLRSVRGLAPAVIANDDDFLEAVLLERRRELYAEGFRWYDLKRTGKAVEKLVTMNEFETHFLYYPVPQEEIDLAGYSQNEGYY